MAVDFNHTIVAARDSQKSATFLADMLALPAPKRWGPFQMVTTHNGANIDFMNTDDDVTPQHYAFLVSEPEFDQIFGRIREQNSATGPIPDKPRRMRSIITMVDVASISRTRTGICWRSSPDPMAAAAGTRDKLIGIDILSQNHKPHPFARPDIL